MIFIKVLAVLFLFVSNFASAQQQPPPSHGEFYDKTPVLTLTSRNFKKTVYGTNYSTLVEFYAPWCGHCQQFRKTMIKMAKSMSPYVQIGAVDCNDANNQQLCSEFRISGFPSFKVFRPPKVGKGKGAVEDYSGERSAKAISQFLVQRIQNNVHRFMSSKKLKSDWLNNENNDETPKLLLFSKKQLITPLLKSLAIDFSGTINFATISESGLDDDIKEQFQVTEFPKLILIPANTSYDKFINYDGIIKKRNLEEFLLNYANATDGPLYRRAKSQSKKHVKKEKIIHDEL